MMNMFGSKKNGLVQTSSNGSGGASFGWISKSVEISGDVNFTDKLQVDGKVTGKLYSEKGTLIIGESGNIEAQIDVGTCIIHGTINGNVKARTRVEVHRTGKLTGDITTPALVMAEGAFCNGNIKMVKTSDSKVASKETAAEESVKPQVLVEESESDQTSAAAKIATENPIVSRVQSAAAERARKTEKVA